MNKQNINIILGDCLEHLRDMNDDTVDCIVTSPPYNIGIKYGKYNDKRDSNEYYSWIETVFRELYRVLKVDGSLFLNIGNQNSNPYFKIDMQMIMREIFFLQNEIIWAKSISIGEDSFGNFKPINSKRYLNNTHESIFHYTKSGNVEIDRLSIGVPFKYKSNISRFSHDSDKRCAGNIWHIPYEPVNSKDKKFNHPAAFPEKLAERCIKMHGGNELMVMDPFMGTGTTMLSALKLGHSAIGIEIDSNYVDTANKRLLNS